MQDIFSVSMVFLCPSHNKAFILCVSQDWWRFGELWSINPVIFNQMCYVSWAILLFKENLFYSFYSPLWLKFAEFIFLYWFYPISKTSVWNFQGVNMSKVFLGVVWSGGVSGRENSIEELRVQLLFFPKKGPMTFYVYDIFFIPHYPHECEFIFILILFCLGTTPNIACSWLCTQGSFVEVFRGSCNSEGGNWVVYMQGKFLTKYTITILC